METELIHGLTFSSFADLYNSSMIWCGTDVGVVINGFTAEGWKEEDAGVSKSLGDTPVGTHIV